MESIVMVASDASGTDGFGYYSGCIEAEDFAFYARKWGGDYEFTSSHTGELLALQHYLVNKYDGNAKVLIWITDSLSAMFSVNKGRCKEESGLKVLENILESCDNYKIQLLAIWVPREYNQISDFLSHLCHVLDREEYQGRSLRNLQVLASQRSSNRRAERNDGSEESRTGVSKLVYKDGMEFIPQGIQL
jgi:hypothetical protein